MILKYYTNGWNYVQCNNLQQFNMYMPTIFEAVVEKENVEKFSSGFNDEKLVDLFRSLVTGNIWAKIEANGFEPFDLNVKFHLLDEMFKQCMYRKNESVYIRVCLFDDVNGEKQALVYHGSSYLLNDNGKTIETISNDRTINCYGYDEEED